MIDYAKTRTGDILRLTGAGAPGYAQLGDLVRVKQVQANGVTVENRHCTEADFLFNCGAARLEPTEWRDDFPGGLTPEDERLIGKIESGEIPCKAIGEMK